jgi:addiction module HigA family antidote
MNTLKNPHPGEILLEDFMKPLELTAYRLAKETGMPQTRLSEIIHGRRSLTADTAVRLSAYFGNDPRFWLGLQNDFDLEEVKRKLSANSPAC